MGKRKKKKGAGRRYATFTDEEVKDAPIIDQETERPNGLKSDQGRKKRLCRSRFPETENVRAKQGDLGWGRGGGPSLTETAGEKKKYSGGNWQGKRQAVSVLLRDFWTRRGRGPRASRQWWGTGKSKMRSYW